MSLIVNVNFRKNTTRNNVPYTWRTLLNEGKLSASIVCKKGHYGILADHEIDKRGIVTPSVVCPEKGCDFHEFITLEDWNKMLKLHQKI